MWYLLCFVALVFAVSVDAGCFTKSYRVNNFRTTHFRPKKIATAPVVIGVSKQKKLG
jgi:hypothetical protein